MNSNKSNTHPFNLWCHNVQWKSPNLLCTLEECKIVGTIIFYGAWGCYSFWGKGLFKLFRTPTTLFKIQHWVSQASMYVYYKYCTFIHSSTCQFHLLPSIEVQKEFRLQLEEEEIFYLLSRQGSHYFNSDANVIQIRLWSQRSTLRN